MLAPFSHCVVSIEQKLRNGVLKNRIKLRSELTAQHPEQNRFNVSPWRKGREVGGRKGGAGREILILYWHNYVFNTEWKDA